MMMKINKYNWLHASELNNISINVPRRGDSICVLWHFSAADIELECLATWKDGSETYLYARLTGAHLHSRDERFRCFVSCFSVSASLSIIFHTDLHARFITQLTLNKAS